MDDKKCVIVVPTYCEQLTKSEEMSLRQLVKVLGRHDICLVVPESLNIEEYKKIAGEKTLLTKRINNDYFKSVSSYCKLVSSPSFYEQFADYEYMLIYQLDAWVFNDELNLWCNKGYDYIGAPIFIRWFVERKRQVGNGGFSLRKIESIIKYLKKHNNPNLPHFEHDDGFFAANYDNDLKIPTKEEAALFSLEVNAKVQYDKTKVLPFGCHAYKRYEWDFWKQFIPSEAAYDDIKNDVTFCILTYKESENAKKWYRMYKDYFNTYIIDTFVVDNNAPNPYKEEFGDDPHILLEHNVYNGGQRQIAYKKMKEDGARWMLTVDADVEMRFGRYFTALLYSIDKVVKSKNIGIYEPSAEKGSKCLGSTIPIPENLHLYNQGTIDFREVEQGEGWFRIVKDVIADKIYPYQNFEDNKYGWGGEIHYYLAKQMGLKVVIDDNVCLYHPAGVAYDNFAAEEEGKRYKAKFAELGVEIPKKKKPEEIKTLVCCIGKDENRYIREFVEYYKSIGFSHICLYDNNNVDGEHFEDVIKDYIDEGFVEIIDYRGRTKCQHQAYEECYHNNKNNYDWILFVDCDEFFTLVHNKTVGQYLAMPQFANYDLIHINWLSFGDCGNVYYEEKPLVERFPKAIPLETKISGNFSENITIKSFVRGGLDDIKWAPPGYSHTPITPLRCCNNVGFLRPSGSPYSAPLDYQLSFIRHYTTKSAEEYADKMLRGFPDQEWDGTRVKNLLETRFFRTNEIKKEKVEVFKKKLGIDLSYLLPKKFEGKKSDDVKIYTLCYAKKNFQFLDDEVITPLQVGAANGTDVCELKDNVGDNISDKNYFYIENTGTYWIWKNVQAKYKGQMQYRRPLQGVDGKMNFDDIFKNYDVITCEPFYHPAHKEPTAEEPLVIVADTVEQGYAFSNCIDDLYVLEMVIKMFHPDYAEDYDKYIKNGPNLYYSSGYIMKGEDYDRYCEFLFDCLDKWLQFANIHNQNELIAHVKYNMEVGKYPRYGGDKSIINNEAAVKWQSEIGGFLGERIWTLWLQHNFAQEKIYKLPYIKMEEGMYT